MTANEGTRREKRGRQLSVPTVMKLSEWGMRFLLTAVLAGAELMGGHSLFALSLVAVCRPGAESSAPHRTQSPASRFRIYALVLRHAGDS